MPSKNENSITWRGDAMRRMAAIHAELHGLDRAKMSAEQYEAKTKELKNKLAALMKKVLA